MSTRTKSFVMRVNAVNPARLGAFWFGIQMVWGALLGISLQARAIELAGPHAIAAYTLLPVAGASVAAVTQILFGILSDRRHRMGSRRTEFYIAGALLGAAAVVWFYLAPNYGQLVAAVITLQFGLNIAIGPYQAAIPDVAGPQTVGSASAWMAALQSLGNAAGILVATFVRSAAAIGLTIAATLLATGAATVTHVRRLNVSRDDEAPLNVTRNFIDLFISRAFVYLGFYTLVGYLLFYVTDTMRGDSIMLTGILFLLFLAAAAGGAAFSGRAVSRFERRNVATIGGGVFIAALVVFVFSANVLPIVGAAIAAGAAWGVFLTADWALGCAFLPRAALATAMGIWNLALIIPQIAAPAAVWGLLSRLSALQSAEAPRLAFALACLEVAAGLFWLRRLPASRPPLNEWGPSGNNG